MKIQVLKICLLLLLKNNFAQTVSDFENLSLSPNSYWNGSSTPDTWNNFSSGNAVFPNYYNSNYGGYWQNGWAYSNMQDSITPGFTNMYSARTASGYNNSANYAIGQQNAKIILSGNAQGKIVNGFYITNTTYAALSMRDGDMFAKKFGDTTGTNCNCPQGSYPDWFKLTIRKWHNGIMGSDSVEFYLADYRFANNNDDYIISNWQWVDLTSLGNVDSLLFTLSSSDVGNYGMNTPAFFAIDNFTTSNSALSINTLNPETVILYPNPATDVINIQSDDNFSCIRIIDINGKIVLQTNVFAKNTSIDIQNLNAGIYYLQLENSEKYINHKFIKQ
jgi:hypothetical protein